jgi:hypothetical protein
VGVAIFGEVGEESTDERWLLTYSSGSFQVGDETIEQPPHDGMLYIIDPSHQLHKTTIPVARVIQRTGYPAGWMSEIAEEIDDYLWPQDTTPTSHPSQQTPPRAAPPQQHPAAP